MAADLNPLMRVTESMVNLMAKKDIIPIFISGRTTTGVITCNINSPIQLNVNATHKIYLQYFTAWSHINNVTIAYTNFS